MSRKRPADDGGGDGDETGTFSPRGASTTPTAKRVRSPSSRARASASGDVSSSRASSAAIEDDEGTPTSLVKPEQDEDMSAYEENSEAASESGEGSQDELDGYEQAEQEMQQPRATESGGHIAEAGVIERVALTDFMCHKRLTVPLGPQINFIIGHNGSGKSAILTGITIALGGKAASTSRGSNLKTFVREGASAAEISLWIKNKGPEAFKHDLYGDRIVIERRINADGGGHWKMKNVSGKTVSNKRDELDALCDHANIQVDNPMSVLTQDSARQFLSSSNAGEMYDFFLRGTQLKQLSEEYTLIRANRERSKRVIEKKEEALPDLERSAREAAAKWHLIQKQKDQHQKLQHLKNQIVWSQVNELEKAVAAAEQRTIKMHGKLEKTKQDIQRLQEVRQTLDEEITRIEAQANGGSDASRPLHEEMAKLKNEAKELKIKLSRARAEASDCDGQYKRLKANVSDLDERISEENAKLGEGNQGRRIKMEATRKDLETKVSELRAEEADLKATLLETSAEIQRVIAEERQVSDQREQLRNQVTNAETICQRLAAATKNSMEAFGAGIPALLRSINNEGRWHKKPVGPIGAHVKLKDEKWAPVLESVIGNTLNAFCVTDHHDRRILEELKRRHDCARVAVITASDEEFDFSSGEPPAQCLTILRALDIDNDYVLRQLVNTVHIESAVLVGKRSEGDVLLRQGLPNVRNCFSGDMYRLTGGQVGSSSSTLRPHTGPPRLSANVQDKLNEARANLAQLQRALQDMDAKVRDLQKRKNQLEEDRRSGRTELTRIERTKRRAEEDREQIQEDLRHDEPANIAALQEARREAQDELTKCQENFNAHQETSAKLAEELRPITGRQRDIQVQLEDLTADDHAVKARLEKAIEQRMQAQNTEKQRLASASKYEEEARLAAEDEEERRLHLGNNTELALKYTDGERVEAPRNQDYYTREVEAVENLLERARREAGGETLEHVVAVYKSKQKAYDDAKSELASIKAVVKQLRTALEERLVMWQDFRRQIALRARVCFTDNLDTRGYTGSLQFHHDKQKLVLKVITEASAGDGRNSTQRNKQRSKDPRSLSGGEKSFSTVCLLLSLWQAVECPIRCLDEFDVFMDAVNRKISVKMLIETAKKAHNVQYVLITPQSMTNTKFGPEVNIQRLSDPERNQGVLNFGS